VPLPSALFGCAEIILDRWLSASGGEPAGPELIGKQVDIQVETSNQQALLSMALLIDGNGIRLLGEPNRATTAADATICGTPQGLIALLANTGGDPLNPAKISGDLQLVKKLAEYLHNANFDLQSLLGELIGPQSGYLLAKWAGQGHQWLTDSGEKIANNLADYLQYETDALVNPLQWQTLNDEITDLQRRTGALQRRLAALQQTPEPD
jgi:ubiquinone biosynthesis protein UbiJ